MGITQIACRNTYNNIVSCIYYMHELNLEGLRFPVKIDQVGKFESQNTDNEVVFPLHITPKRDVTHINLLLLSDGDKQHNCLITNMSRLLNDRTKHKGSELYCNYCLHAFRRQDLLDDHVPYCQPHGPQRISMPNEDNKCLKFNHLGHQLRVPFVIYVDFECYTEPALRPVNLLRRLRKTISTTPRPDFVTTS